jgi:hypothetical protein
MRNPGAPPSFAALVQSFFAEHLTQQRALSARTVAAYRDAFMRGYTSHPRRCCSPTSRRR